MLSSHLRIGIPNAFNKIPVRFFFFNVPNIIMITFSQGPEAEILVQNSSPAIKFLTANPQSATITIRLNAVPFYWFIHFPLKSHHAL